MATSREMTEGRALPLIFNFTLPLLLGNLLQQTYSLVDAAIVGKFLGINALASVGASTSVIFLILGFCNGCCGGFGIPVAQKFGALHRGRCALHPVHDREVRQSRRFDTGAENRFRKIAGYAIPLMRSSKADNAALAPSPIAMTICL